MFVVRGRSSVGELGVELVSQVTGSQDSQRQHYFLVLDRGVDCIYVLFKYTERKSARFFEHHKQIIWRGR